MSDTHAEPVLRTEQHGPVTWVDALRPDKATLTQLEQEYKLHPVHVKESLQKVQHAQVEHGDDYLFLVLHVPMYDTHRRKIVIHQLGMFLGKSYLLTIRTETIPALERAIAASDEYARGAAYLLYLLIQGVLSDMFGLSEHIESELDAIQTQVFDDSISDAQRIGRLRQKIVSLARVVGPKRVALDDLAQQIGPFAGKEMTPYYRNNAKTVDRLWEIVDEARETVEIYKDADFTASTERTNAILSILTFVFTFTIPATVIAGLYGMNVLIPGGLDAGSWTFLGRYTTFFLIVGFAVLSVVGMFVYFKRKKWF